MKRAAIYSRVSTLDQTTRNLHDVEAALLGECAKVADLAMVPTPGEIRDARPLALVIPKDIMARAEASQPMC